MFRRHNRTAIKKVSLPSAKSTASERMNPQINQRIAKEEKKGKAAVKERAITDCVTMITHLSINSHLPHSKLHSTDFHICRLLVCY